VTLNACQNNSLFNSIAELSVSEFVRAGSLYALLTSTVNLRHSIKHLTIRSQFSVVSILEKEMPEKSRHKTWFGLGYKKYILNFLSMWNQHLYGT
jgi:hypothetical protein